MEAAALLICGRAALGRLVFDRPAPERRAQARNNTIAAGFLASGICALRPQDVRGIEAPVLLISGDRRAALFPRLIDLLADLLPRPERVTSRRPRICLMHEQDPVLEAHGKPS